MKRLVTLLVLALFIAAGFNASAQVIDRKERKEWKKRIKALEPEQYKAFIEENESLKNQVSSLKRELSEVDDKLADKDNQISQDQKQIASLKNELSEANSKLSRPVNQNDMNENVGVVFKVQIGAYKNKDLSRYRDAKNFTQDEENGMKKYALGTFRDYWEADTFKKYLREMGVKDAWIISYKNGQRVPIKDVLEGVIKS